MIVGVLLPLPFNEPFDYESEEELPLGTIVRVPWGKEEQIGVVWKHGKSSGAEGKRIKTVIEKYDFPPLSGELRRLVEFTASYNCAPLGLVLKMVISVRQAFDNPQTTTLYRLTGKTLAEAGLKNSDARWRVMDLLRHAPYTKAEICKVIPQKHCCALAECFGILLCCNSFHGDAIKIITESRDFSYILPKLFKKSFDLEFDSYPSMEALGKLIFQIWDTEKIKEIMNAFGFDIRDTLSLHVNLPVVEEDCCKTAFLRGAFLAGGSVTNPGKGYHMELTTTHQSVARETGALMREAIGFSPKLAARGGGQVLYLKQSDQISDFLTYLGAPLAAMGIMEMKLEKDLNNKVNRRCNCDDANISKVVEAAQDQLAAIRVLQERGVLESLPWKIQQAANARLGNPAASLSELAEMMDPPISKPAMNNRMKKLVLMAKEAGK